MLAQLIKDFGGSLLDANVRDLAVDPPMVSPLDNQEIVFTFQFRACRDDRFAR